MGHGCGGEDHTAVPGDAIRVNLYNWAIDASQLSARAGRLTFDVRHYHPPGPHSHDDGGLIHHLTIARREPGGGFTVVAQSRDLKENERQVMTVQLAAGDYELQCVLTELVNGQAVSHYERGMRLEFTVQ
jgi:hypothetical protein